MTPFGEVCACVCVCWGGGGLGWSGWDGHVCVGVDFVRCVVSINCARKRHGVTYLSPLPPSPSHHNTRLGLVEEVEGQRVQILVADLRHGVLQRVKCSGEGAHPVCCLWARGRGLWCACMVCGGGGGGKHKPSFPPPNAASSSHFDFGIFFLILPQTLPERPRLPHALALRRPLTAQEATVVSCV
jgi:hypothetical protein